MPTNITQGNSAQFIVQFTSTSGAIIVPPSALLTVTYYSGGVAASTSPTLTLNGSYYVGTWSTATADLGIADWTVSSTLSTYPAQLGSINVIDP